MEVNQIKVVGKIHFEPINLTKKHNSQASWKRVAMVIINDDLSEYYAWFIRKRFNLTLNPPQRGSHVTFINDTERQIRGQTPSSRDALWNNVKSKYESKNVEFNLNIEPRSDGKYWWLRVSNGDNLQAVRDELGLGSPFFSFHLTIGYSNEKNIEHSMYIHHICTSALANL